MDGVVTEMTNRFGDLANSCDHDAVFALVYLRTTEEYRRTVAADPLFFADTAYVNREDAVFADDYFEAYDGWHAGAGTAPQAWAIAFEAAERREVSGGGNILLGMNAHINRDLPFALASMGLVHADGSQSQAGSRQGERNPGPGHARGRARGSRGALRPVNQKFRCAGNHPRQRSCFSSSW